MLAALRRGDRIVTGGGLIGTISKVADDELSVDIADGVRVKVVRSTVSNVLAKPEPARGRSQEAEADDAEEDEEDEEAVPVQEKPRRQRGGSVARK